jgi:hypothetical protein
VVLAVLAGGLIVEVIVLDSNNRALCSNANSMQNTIIITQGEIINITSTLRAQIQNDQSLIGQLNSTRPQGYQGMIATLNSQVKADTSIIAALQQLQKEILSHVYASQGILFGQPLCP